MPYGPGHGMGSQRQMKIKIRQEDKLCKKMFRYLPKSRHLQTFSPKNPLLFCENTAL